MRAVRVAFQPPFELREVVRQVYMAGWRSLPLVMTPGLAIGVVLSMHTRATMERFGAEALIPAALAIAVNAVSISSSRLRSKFDRLIA